MKLGLTYLLAPSARPTASPAIFPPLSPRLASPRPSSPSSLRSWLLNRVGRDRWSKKLEATVGNSLTRAQNRSAASELCQRDISEIAVTPESLWWLNDSVLLSLPSPSSFPRNSWSKGSPTVRRLLCVPECWNWFFRCAGSFVYRILFELKCSRIVSLLLEITTTGGWCKCNEFVKYKCLCK